MEIPGFAITNLDETNSTNLPTLEPTGKISGITFYVFATVGSFVAIMWLVLLYPYFELFFNSILGSGGKKKAASQNSSDS